MWDANIYNKYKKERMQPSIDLVSRLVGHKFNRIIDVGCGSGMSTKALMEVWKDAQIIGVDLSEDMLQKAKEELPECTFYQKDCSQRLDEFGTFDLIFSNAFMQWLPNQEEFIANSFQMLNDGGVFATQIPMFHEMPVSQCIVDAEKVIPSERINQVHECHFHCFSPLVYYDMIVKVTSKVNMWITDYCHVMEDYEEIMTFLSGSAFRPYIEALNEQQWEQFTDEVRNNLKKMYPVQQNGKILFPFKRCFLIGEKFL